MRSIRIGGALIIAVFFISSAYIFSGPNFLGARPVDAESTEELLKAYAAKDTDLDGLPDWQEALYGTDPQNPTSTTFGVLDGEAVSKGLLTPTSSTGNLPEERAELTPEDLPGVDPADGSITDEFSKAFFQSYVAAGGGSPLSEEDQKALIITLMQDFTKRAGSALSSKYTIVSVKSSSAIDVLEYAGAVENIFRTRDVEAGEAEPLVLMEQLLQNEDESARPKLERLGASYAQIAKDLLQTRVPKNLAGNHLILIQSFDSLAKATNIVAVYEKDPVAVMGALSVYQPASESVVVAIKRVATGVLVYGEPLGGTAGALLVQIARGTETP